MRIVLFLFFLLLLPLPTRAAETVNLPVPHLWEIPDGLWVKPWNGACEEASMIMTERYYLGDKTKYYARGTMKQLIQPLFAIEDGLFGSNGDTSATRTLKVINDFTSFDATAKENPTLEEIKQELENGRPVISLHYGLDLKNPLHRFRRGGSSYHMMVITGFDDASKEFLVNDPELKNGLDFRYNYDIIMNSLHDFNQATHKADGPPTVLFTKPKQIVRAEGGRRIYLVRDGKKYLITTPAIMITHRLAWSLVKTIPKTELESLPFAGAIEK